MPQTPAATPDGRVTAGGIAPAVLARHVDRYGAPSARELTRWLLAEQLAVETEDGRLRPTPLAVELADWTR